MLIRDLSISEVNFMANAFDNLRAITPKPHRSSTSPLMIFNSISIFAGSSFSLLDFAVSIAKDLRFFFLQKSYVNLNFIQLDALKRGTFSM